MASPFPTQIRISRTDPGSCADFTLNLGETEYLLSVLFRIQEDYDPSLCFRYNCQSSQCGICLLLVNGKETRTCDTRIGDVITSGMPRIIHIQPLERCEVLRDLIVDFDGTIQQFVVESGSETSPTQILDLKRRAEQGWLCLGDQLAPESRESDQ